MVAQVNLAPASLGLLILDATDRQRRVLAEEAHFRFAVVVGKAHAVRIVAIVLRRTPEVRRIALSREISIVEPVANRKCREPESIRT